MTILACDLGGTLMKIGVVRDGRVLAQTSEASNSGAGLAPGLPRLKAAWLRLLNELNITPRDCAGISVAFPSLVNTKSGQILAEYGKYADATNYDLRAWAKQELELPLALENDARMAVVGEWKFGAGRGSDNMVMMTLGTGLGTAAVMEGQLLRGIHGQAGVLIGHASVRYNGRQCYCGNVGCAEAEASTAVLSEVAAALPEWGESTLRNLPTLDYAAVFAHAAAGDRCALKLREYSLAVAFVDVNSPGLWVWEFATGKAPRKLSTSMAWSVQCLSFTRDSDGILFKQGGELVTLDVKTGEPVSHFSILSPRTTRHASQGTGRGNLCLGPAGDRVVVSNSAGFSVDVWDLRTGRLLYGLPQRAGIVYWLAWSPDGRRLAVARSDGDVTIWNLTAVEQSLAQLRLSP